MNEERLVAYYATRGRAHEIKVFERQNSTGLKHYNIQSFYQKSLCSSAIGLEESEMGMNLARTIYFAKKIDRISYAPVIPCDYTEALLNPR